MKCKYYITFIIIRIKNEKQAYLMLSIRDLLKNVINFDPYEMCLLFENQVYDEIKFIMLKYK